MAPRVRTGQGSGRGRGRPAASSQTRASATPQPRPLAPASTSSNAPTSNNAPALNPNTNPRPQGVTMGDGDNVQVRVDPAFEADVRAGNGDVDLAAAVSGLLLLGATTGPATRASQSNTATSSTAQGPSRTRVVRKDKGTKRRKLNTSEPETPVPPVAELSIHAFRGRRILSGLAVPRFNIFQAILQHVHIFFHFITCVDVDTLVSLYAISKDVHNMVNTCNSAVIIAQAMRYAPVAATTFPFRCYRKLCNDDPRVDLDVTRGRSRLIPSFRWLRMVNWRHQIAHKIVRLLNEEGLYLPVQGETAVKKVWFLMDIPDNQRRLAVIQNPELWTTADLFYACMFFMRLDMRCTDPLVPRAHASIRRMLMAQPSMTMTCLVLERKFLLNKIEAMQTYMRWKGTPVTVQQQNVFGVPQRELGLLQYEGYGKVGSQAKLQRPDELVLKECVRRRMKMETAFFCMLNYAGPRQANAAVGDAAHASAHPEASAHTSAAANADAPATFTAHAQASTAANANAVAAFATIAQTSTAANANAPATFAATATASNAANANADATSAATNAPASAAANDDDDDATMILDEADM